MPNLTSRKEIKLKVQEGKKKERLDIYLVSVLEHATRNRVQKLIKEGLVLVNGKVQKANYQINPGDEIHVSIPVTPHPSENLPEDIPLDIVYEDEFLLVVNKPAGMVVHPAFGNYTGTLVNALLHHTKNLSGINTPERPGIVHRLDKDTSGLILIAKNDWTHSQLAKQFSEHSIEREYWAICWGKFKNKKGEIIKNIARSKSDRKKFTVSDSEGKYAHTIYEVLEEFEFTSLVKLNLKTGRTHQIRVHLSSIHHPVFGDPTYGGRKIVYGLDLPKIKARVNNLLEIMPRQALHAKTLGFFHPDKKEFFLFDSPLPSDFQTLLEKLSSNS
jgi:23S rRNA pseudouridine1911/1915/1917 synthase